MTSTNYMCTLGRFLGCGSSAQVISAVYVDDDGLRQEIAVKRAPIQRSYSLQRELRILEAFSDCPEIIDSYSDQTTSSDEEGQFYNIFLELAPGGSLQDLIRRPGLPEKDVWAYTRMILEALKRLHDMSYVHCGVEPENILLFPSVDYPHRLKLAGFGRSKGPGEWASGESVGPEADVWSLGRAVVMMATGEWPWAGQSGMGEEAKDFVRKCLESDPRNRWTVQSLLRHPYVARPLIPMLLPHEIFQQSYHNHSNAKKRSGSDVTLSKPRKKLKL